MTSTRFQNRLSRPSLALFKSPPYTPQHHPLIPTTRCTSQHVITNRHRCSSLSTFLTHCLWFPGRTGPHVEMFSHSQMQSLITSAYELRINLLFDLVCLSA